MPCWRPQSRSPAGRATQQRGSRYLDSAGVGRRRRADQLLLLHHRLHLQPGTITSGNSVEGFAVDSVRLYVNGASPTRSS